MKINIVLESCYHIIINCSILLNSNICFFRIKDHPLNQNPQLREMYKHYTDKVNLQSELEIARRKLFDAKKILQMNELKCRKRVLRRLDYSTKEDVIMLKGRVACELSR